MDINFVICRQYRSALTIIFRSAEIHTIKKLNEIQGKPLKQWNTKDSLPGKTSKLNNIKTNT